MRFLIHELERARRFVEELASSTDLCLEHCIHTCDRILDEPTVLDSDYELTIAILDRVIEFARRHHQQ